jgi:ABC-type nitrate/sulfonate/bicarbonate transport system substrate-binding protein
LSYTTDLAGHDPIIFHTASRKFAEDHPGLIKAFRASIGEAAPIVNSDGEAATQSIAKTHQDAGRHRSRRACA